MRARIRGWRRPVSPRPAQEEDAAPGGYLSGAAWHGPGPGARCAVLLERSLVSTHGRVRDIALRTEGIQMIDHVADPGESGPGETQALAISGGGAMLTPELDDGGTEAVPGWARDSGTASTWGRVHQTWRQRLGI